MSHGHDENLVIGGVERVLRQVAGATAVDDELAPRVLEGTAYERILLENAKGFEDEASRIRGGKRILSAQKGDKPPKVLQRGRRHPDNRHGITPLSWPA